MRSLARLSLPALLGVCLACFGDDPGSSNAEQASTPEEWGLVEELRIGSLDGDEAAQFGRVSAVMQDRAGRVYVLDYPTQEIRLFDTDGRFIRTIGGMGRGPGEFAGAAGMNLTPEGELVVWDTRNRRFSIFSRNFEFERSVPRHATGVIYPWRGGFTPVGEFIDWGYSIRPDAGAGAGPDDLGEAASTGDYHSIRVDLSDGAVDTVGHFVGTRELSRTGMVPFARGSILHQARLGDVWISEPTSNVLTRYSIQGDSVSRHVLPGDAVPVEQADLDSVRTAAESMRLPVVHWDAVPETKQVVRRIFDDAERFIYVMSEVVGAPLGTRAEVLESASGRHVATLHFPERVAHPYPAPYATATHILAGVQDSIGVPYVVRYRIVRPEG